MKFLGLAIRRGGSREEVNIKGDRYGNVHISQGLPAYTEITAQGEGWQVMTTSPVACLNIRPSTTSLATLWNGESGGGKSYIVDRVFAQQLVSESAVVARWGLWVCVHKEMAAPTAEITAIRGLSGKYNYTGKGRYDADAGVVDDGWFPWGEGMDVETVSTIGGNQVSANVGGRIVIPPQCGLSLHGVASTINVDLCVGVAWYEVQLDLE